MKKFILAVLAVLPMLAIAAGPSMDLDKANNDLRDKESLKRGFEAYINNCLACHELKYQRYNRTFADLGISDQDGAANYMYTGEKVGDHITNTMPGKEAAKWFGSTPPDLTLEARFRSPDWIYTYLRSFYADESRPFGVNNKVFKDVGMPHVLQNLQGVRTMDEHGNLSEATGGSMTTEEYDEFARDLTNFLEYTGEPNKLERENLGYWVIGFLFILLFFAYLLKKEYWRDVH
ncbi:cytochrome c1 [Cognaticolwellia beringensis]|uniref:Cytochrome c1 n=1 Tax=Cognaticolwellia beringensis TaxID=1967665 RepID=A0A222G7U3_9GAMM|nr:cytochrome c1 [Cognaticolwellia beringensis]ASP47434.1 cytochrome c1 [Cognaticolwellia beringensis]|tara:strand:+ start:207 stop:905 length:699 start_codon:yes stop_codon:yes gene_type:complete